MTQSAGFMDLNETGKLEIDFFFDVRCPFAYQAALWMQEVAELFGSDLIDLRWRFFSLEQINRKDPNWNIWEQKPGAENTASLWSFLAGAAINKSFSNAHLGKFYLALARMYHEEGKPVNERANIEAAAEEAGVAVSDLASVFEGTEASGYNFLQSEHTEAVERYGAFGVPTIVFEEKYSTYLKMMPKPQSDKVLEVFNHVMLVTMVEPTVYEIKRPMTRAQEQDLSDKIKALKQVAQPA